MCSHSKTSLYTQNDLKTLLNEYITEKNLVNVHQRAYINVSTDPALHALLTSKKDDGILEFMKREEVIGKVIEKMQAWYEIVPVGGESIVKYVVFSSVFSRPHFGAGKAN